MSDTNRLCQEGDLLKCTYILQGQLFNSYCHLWRTRTHTHLRHSHTDAWRAPCLPICFLTTRAPMLSVLTGFNLRRWHSYISIGEFKPITLPPAPFLDWLEKWSLLSSIWWNVVEVHCLDFFKTFLNFQIQGKKFMGKMRIFPYSSVMMCAQELLQAFCEHRGKETQVKGDQAKVTKDPVSLEHHLHLNYRSLNCTYII